MISLNYLIDNSNYLSNAHSSLHLPVHSTSIHFPSRYTYRINYFLDFIITILYYIFYNNYT